MDVSTPMPPVSPLFPLFLLSLSVQKHAPVTKDTFKKEYDYIIVGAGSAGSVVASRLSELLCVNVLLLEAGSAPPILTDCPLLSAQFVGSYISWNYTTTPQKHTGNAYSNNQVKFFSGKTLGGTSVINSMLVSRGNPINYDEWADMGAKGWSYKEVQPYFLKQEDNKNIEYVLNGYHNVGGPMTVIKPNYESEMKQTLMQAALDLGYEFVDANGPNQEGFYDLQSTTRNGQRCSTAKAYLVPGEYRPNLDILAEAQATKIVFDGNRAKGVQFDFKGSSHFVTASKEVILSAGAIGSAKLLMLSGVGPREDLENLKIPVIADLPVGLNFQDHYGTFVAFEMDSSIMPPIVSKTTNDENYQEYISFKSGPLASPYGVSLLAYLSNVNSTNAQSLPDHELAFIEVDATQFKASVSDEIYEKVFKEYENKAMVMCLSGVLHPESRGKISLNSDDPYDTPVVDPNYYEHPSDITDVVEGLKQCREIMLSPTMSGLVVKEFVFKYPDCENMEDDQLYLECATKYMLIASSHLSGTVKMGDPSDPTTVVDPQLRVKTITGLRVIDASVMPKLVWGKTNVPTIMIGEKASDMIKETISCN